MKRIIFIIALVWAGASRAQNSISKVLESIEHNSTTLKAMRENLTAQKAGNHTGLTLPNPEVELGYLWGSPSPIGNRTDISVSQAFDFATLLGAKKRMAGSRDKAADLEYAVARNAYMLRAKQLCIDLLYTNELLSILQTRMAQMDELLQLYDKRMSSGDANVLEINKAKQNSRLVKAELLSTKTENEQMKTELIRLNGGNELDLNSLSYTDEPSVVDFTTWMKEAESRNATLAYSAGLMEVSQREVKLAKAEGLPNITAGFMQEKVAGERYAGVKLGITIPLWENKNRVRQAKAATVATQTQHTDERVQLAAVLKSLYSKAKAQQQVMEEYKEAMKDNNTAELLHKAFLAGQISSMDYIRELDVFFELLTKSLASERDYRKTLSEMKAYEL